MRWSSAGPIPGMRCTQIHEGADPHTWSDNYLCVPPHGAGASSSWSSAGPVPGMQCVQWLEPADPHTWADNYLCWQGGGRCASRQPAPFAPPVFARRRP
jgi:hypothetical protein